jgi:hypothetical protein
LVEIPACYARTMRSTSFWALAFRSAILRQPLLSLRAAVLGAGDRRQTICDSAPTGADLCSHFAREFGFVERPPSLLETVDAIRALPYRRNSERTPQGVIDERRGTCSTKHLLLYELCRHHWPETDPQLVHRIHRLFPDDARRLFDSSVARAVPTRGLVDIHRYLTILRDRRRIRIDVTFPEQTTWDGRTSMALACGDGVDVPSRANPDTHKRRLERIYCDPAVREPFIAALVTWSKTLSRPTRTTVQGMNQESHEVRD